jgi:hypothetical protein
MALVFGLVIGLASVVFGLVPLWWSARGQPGRADASAGFTVTVEGTIPGGDVVYREGEHEAHFGWDLGGRAPYLMFVYVPDEAAWPERLPWASGRREDVLERIAREVKRLKVPRARVEFAEDRIDFLER